MANILTNFYLEEDKVDLKLASREYSWGMANLALKSLRSDAGALILSRASEINQSIEQENAHELADRERRIVAIIDTLGVIAQTSIAVGAASRANRPEITTCNAWRNTATCVTNP